MAQFIQVSLDNPEIATENIDINLQNSMIPEILETTSAVLTAALRPSLEVELLFLVAGKTPTTEMESAREDPCSVVVAASEGEERRRSSLVLFLCRSAVRLVHYCCSPPEFRSSPLLCCSRGYCCSTQETEEVGSSSTEGKPTAATIAIARC
nr:hypothetical protein Itr_chr08CG08970 [Ipomoea trifida]